MKIPGICCSPRKGQTTFKVMEVCLTAACEVDEKIDTELIELVDKGIGPCIAGSICKEALICDLGDDLGELIHGHLAARGQMGKMRSIHPPGH